LRFAGRRRWITTIRGWDVRSSGAVLHLRSSLHQCHDAPGKGSLSALFTRSAQIGGDVGG